MDPTPAASFAAIRVNAGGGAYTDDLGQAWSADTGFLSGTVFATTTDIQGTSNAALYQSQRWNPGPLEYRFTVPNGSYTVNLKFAELYFSAAGRRSFNVVINGQTVLSNFDVVGQAGAPFTAIDWSFPVSVSSGQISIQFAAVIDYPMVNGIEILSSTAQPAPASAPPPPPPVPAPAPTTTTFNPIRVNAGGGAYTDSLGQVWSADNGYSAGSAFSTGAPIRGTSDATLYQTHRWNGGPLTYSFTVPNGSYTVKLKFAEVYFSQPGQRVFNVVINGQAVLTNFDIVAQAGGALTAIDRSATVAVTGGQISIQLTPVTENPEINAIEIVAVPTSTPAFTPIRVNVGGVAYTDTLGRLWSADTGYVGGNVYTNSGTVKGTSDQPLYQTQRWNPVTMDYQFAVPDGNYTVNLKFAELYFSQPGQRIFNVAINGQTVLANFDILAQAGGAFTVVDRAFPVSVTGGKLTIHMVASVNNPTINAIEIY